MTTDKKSNLFFGGIPTGPDVDALIEELGIPEEGDVITYSDIERVIGVKRDQNRWRSVTIAWKKRLDRKHNIVFEAIPNEGFKVMNPSERVTFGAKKMKQTVKMVDRTVNVLRRTPKDRLSEEDRFAAEHWILQGSKSRIALVTAPKPQKYPELEMADIRTRNQAGLG